MSDGGVENVLTQDLERFVKNEALEWGDNATKLYFEPAEMDADRQWALVQRFLAPFPIDYTHTMELSCGHGRNSEKLATLSKTIVLVDVNRENIVFCKKRFPDKPWRFVLNNGFDLREIPDRSITFAHCFEAAVHFDLEVILSYIKEFRRVLTPGAFGFVHHSNVTNNPGADFRRHPHWRNFMSKEIFAHLCVHNGLDIVDQYIFDQGGPEADCFSLFRKDEVAETSTKYQEMRSALEPLGEANQRIHQLEETLAEAKKRIHQLEETTQRLDADNVYQCQLNKGIRGSLTWKLASPLWRLETRSARKKNRRKSSSVEYR